MRKLVFTSMPINKLEDTERTFLGIENTDKGKKILQLSANNMAFKKGQRKLFPTGDLVISLVLP